MRPRIPPRLVKALRQIVEDATAARSELCTVWTAWHGSKDIGDTLFNDACAEIGDNLFVIRSEATMLLQELESRVEPLDRINRAGGRVQENDNDGE